MFAKPSRIIFASWDVRSIAFAAYSFVFHASFPHIKLLKHLLPPVLSMPIAGIILMDQDSLAVAEAVVIVNTSCTGFIHFNLPLSLLHKMYKVSLTPDLTV